MEVKFLSEGVWDRLLDLALRPRRSAALVAVPYLGAGAAKRLPLRDGDLLVTRFDDGAFATGVVDPKEVIKYLRRGVEVHAWATLHAKVFVLGRTAIVGSTNVSANSAEHLVEAACESNAAGFVSAAARFVRSLRGDVVSLDFARLKLPLYRPPRRTGSAGKRQKGKHLPQSSLAAVSLTGVDYDESDTRAEQKGTEVAASKLDDASQFTVSSFRWTGTVLPTLRPGVRLLRCTRINKRRIEVEAPARILSISRYRSGRGTPRALVFVEAPKRVRKKTLKDIIARVPAAALLRRGGSCRQIRDADLAFKLGQLWARAK